ncbi:hypothetical protein Dimus_030636 [Dionaea muscipula]
MRFFKRIAGILGLGKDDCHGANSEDAGSADTIARDDNSDQADVEPAPGPRKGFSVPVKVPVERSSLGPVVVSCGGDGGVQVHRMGYSWMPRRDDVTPLRTFLLNLSQTFAIMFDFIQSYTVEF